MMVLPSFIGWSAEESVSRRFSRVMKATTSRWGVLTDPPLVAIATAPPFVAFMAGRQLAWSSSSVLGLEVLAALPLVVAVGVTLSLTGARARTVAWLRGLPFPLDNLNAVLNGVGDFVEVHFSGEMPDERRLNAALDGVHPDAFVTKHDAEAKVIEVRIGVVDDKRNPARSNFARYERVRGIVDRVLVPTNAEFPVAGVYLK